MKKIFRHIEYLLLEHDYVIIPQLGGFVAKSMPSVWNAEEELFFPPYRTVHFNASLNHGDTLLVDSLVEAYSITPTEAEKWCVDFVQSIHLELAANGSLDFGSIGVMMQEDPSQPITFSPCKAGVTTPSLYGLDAFHMPLLSMAEQLSVAERTQDFLPQHTQADKAPATHYVLHLNRRITHFVASIAASILLFLVYSTPLQDHEIQVQQAELFIPTHLYAPAQGNIVAPCDSVSATSVLEIAEETTVIDVQQENTEVAKEIENLEEEKALQEEPSMPAVETKVAECVGKKEVKNWAIVLASSISLRNAEAYAQTLQTRGHDAHVYQKGKMVRVIIPCYDGEQKARECMKEMKQSSQEFHQIWITTLD